MAEILAPAILLTLQIAHCGAAAAPYSGSKLLVVNKSRDYVHGGAGRVRGTVKEKGTPNAPVFRRVRLFRERDGLFVREQWSDKVTGAYDFQNIAEQYAYTVVSYDHEHNYRAVIADNLTPEMMP